MALTLPCFSNADSRGSRHLVLAGISTARSTMASALVQHEIGRRSTRECPRRSGRYRRQPEIPGRLYRRRSPITCDRSCRANGEKSTTIESGGLFPSASAERNPFVDQKHEFRHMQDSGPCSTGHGAKEDQQAGTGQYPYRRAGIDIRQFRARFTIEELASACSELPLSHIHGLVDVLLETNYLALLPFPSIR